MLVVVLFMVLGAAALIAISSIWRGYVLSVLWGWFVVPFFGARPLPLAMAIGISLIVGFLTIHRTGKEAEKEMGTAESFGLSCAVMVFVPLAVLAAGWVAHQFI
jgi:hypothetical protein